MRDFWVRVGRSPPFVLGGIQLSDLPGSRAELIDPFRSCSARDNRFTPTQEPQEFYHRISWFGYRFCFVANHLWLCLTAPRFCTERGASSGHSPVTHPPTRTLFNWETFLY